MYDLQLCWEACFCVGVYVVFCWEGCFCIGVYGACMTYSFVGKLVFA